MKGIILAGGAGTRLRPATTPVCKQLLPVYDKPMIYYPLSVYLQAGIRDILIITNPSERDLFYKVLGDGSRFGARIEYAVQKKPNGLAEAFIVGETFVGDAPCALILGDNIFYGDGLSQMCASAIGAAQSQQRATVFAYQVADPERYGVVSFDGTGKAVKLEEKPKAPESNWAVTGLYVFDKDACARAKTLRPSQRGELEITDLIRLYLDAGNLQIERLGRGFAWLDTGTFDSLHEAASFVRTVELRQGIKIACLEEIAFAMGYIDAAQLERTATDLGNNDYSAYLLKVLKASLRAH